MVRPLNLKIEGVNILDLEDEKYDNFKDAVFYLNGKTVNLEGVKFNEWLIEKYKNGFQQEDIEEFNKDVRVGNYQALKSKVNVLPPFISIIIDMLAKANGIETKGVSR